MGRWLAALLIGMTGCRGCDGSQDAWSPPPLEDASPPLPSASGTVRAPPSWPIRPTELEGIFPPAWKKSDEWRIQYPEYDPAGGGHLLQTAIFRVVAVPSKDDDVYRVTVRHGPDAKPSYWITFRRKDFSVASVKGGIHDIDNGAHPFARTKGPVFVFPMWPPGLVNPFFFDPGPDADGEPQEGWQHILRDPDSLEIMVVARNRYRYENFRAIVEWRRGDPWWSSVHCFRLGGLEALLPTALPEAQTCEAWLVRDPAPAHPKK